MRLGRESNNVEDRRGMGLPIMAGGGIGAVVLALVAMFFGVDPRSILSPAQAPPAAQSGAPGAAPTDAEGVFVSKVLADTEDTWTTIFHDDLGRQYEPPKLVLFSGGIESACGMGQTASGPFYCPNDHKVYIDLEFYQELKDRFQAPGDFAQAYVIAHEVGHHVQTLIGTMDQVDSRRAHSSRGAANALSVETELQADCYAGVWANRAQKMRNILEPGELEQALNAASAIGDDHIQKQTTGRVNPDSFTHGSSEQRVHWFKEGFNSGDMKRCDTFASLGG